MSRNRQNRINIFTRIKRPKIRKEAASLFLLSSPPTLSSFTFFFLSFFTLPFYRLPSHGSIASSIWLHMRAKQTKPLNTRFLLEIRSVALHRRAKSRPVASRRFSYRGRAFPRRKHDLRELQFRSRNNGSTKLLTLVHFIGPEEMLHRAEKRSEHARLYQRKIRLSLPPPSLLFLLSSFSRNF